LVLVHGFAADKDIWTLMAPHIPRRFGLIVPDLPGFGDSSRRAEERYDVATQSRRLAAFLDLVGGSPLGQVASGDGPLGQIRRLHVVASSMGGNIAARLAIDQPDRFASLTLIAPLGVVSPQPSDAERELANGRNPLLVENAADFDHLMDLVFAQPPDVLAQDFVRSYLARRAVADSRFAKHVFDDLQQHPDWFTPSDLAKIIVPTLLIWGDADRVIPAACGPLWRDQIPNARLEIMPGAGHVPMAERPLDTALTILSFLPSPHA
jgi:pimeloyl-ACP methyl ester carboxylesterase